MKKLIVFVVVVVLSIGSVFSQGWDQYHEIKRKINELGFSIDKDLYSGLKEGESFVYEKTFYAGWSYIVVGFSIDSDVNDVDVVVYENDGSLYKKDTDTEPIALVEISTSFTRNMKVYVKNYDSDTPALESNCRLLIASRRNW